ncbi:MAG: glycosyltransferase family 2 protein [Candidatus Margulisbacteria bacterium]|nr:glycosyltransferase family 2 protein [Candidatus Margulisiibacteriota bacterium]
MPAKAKKTRPPTLSVCLIVRDAAENLALCLDSVQKAADEIIVVDTGSRDNTVEIARKYTDKIYFFQWRDDFAAARNESLKHATGDWILILDDDEILRPGSARKLKKILAAQPPEQNVYTVLIYDCEKTDAEKELRGGQKYAGFRLHTHGRLLRNRRDIWFRHTLHERITEKDGETLYSSGVALLHYGYHQPDPERFKRNFAIVQKALAENPDDLACHYNYARTYSTQDDCAMPELVRQMERTIELYLQGKKNVKCLPLSLIYGDFIDILQKRENYAQAEKYCYAWISRLGDKYDLTPFLRLGKNLFFQQKFDECERVLQMVYAKSKNGLSFCAAELLAEFKAELYFFYGTVLCARKNYKLGLKLLRLVRDKYFNNAQLEKLISSAEEMAAARA